MMSRRTPELWLGEVRCASVGLFEKPLLDVPMSSVAAGRYKSGESVPLLIIELHESVMDPHNMTHRDDDRSFVLVWKRAGILFPPGAEVLGPVRIRALFC